MFRKFTHILIAILLLITTMGFSVSKHYCGSRLIEISINSVAEPCCSGMETSGCCHDETEYFQFDEDFVSSIIIENIQITDFDILFPLAIIYVFNTPEGVEKDILDFAESPPPRNLHTTLSLFQTYLI